MGRITLYNQPGGQPGFQIQREDTRAYRDLFQRRWYEHVIYTRDAILSWLSNDNQNINVSVARLLKNQDDIGALLRPFYPGARVDAIVVLLKEHVKQAADIVVAVMTMKETSPLISVWRANGQAIVQALTDLNPGWQQTPLMGLWNRHLNLIISEVVFRKDKNWKDDIVNLDKIIDNIQRISDILVDGIVRQPSFEMQKASQLLSQKTL